MRTRQIQRAIIELYGDPNLDLNILADALNVKTSYLREIVHRYFACGPHCLIETVRLEQAILLLPNPDMPLYTISAEVGYTNAKTFRRAFKKRTDMSPQEFRTRLADCSDPQTEIDDMIDKIWQCCRRR